MLWLSLFTLSAFTAVIYVHRCWHACLNAFIVHSNLHSAMHRRHRSGVWCINCHNRTVTQSPCFHRFDRYSEERCVKLHLSLGSFAVTEWTIWMCKLLLDCSPNRYSIPLFS